VQYLFFFWNNMSFLYWSLGNVRITCSLRRNRKTNDSIFLIFGGIVRNYGAQLGPSTFCMDNFFLAYLFMYLCIMFYSGWLFWAACKSICGLVSSGRNAGPLQLNWALGHRKIWPLAVIRGGHINGVIFNQVHFRPIYTTNLSWVGLGHKHG